MLSEILPLLGARGSLAKLSGGPRAQKQLNKLVGSQLLHVRYNAKKMQEAQGSQQVSGLRHYRYPSGILQQIQLQSQDKILQILQPYVFLAIKKGPHVTPFRTTSRGAHLVPLGFGTSKVSTHFSCWGLGGPLGVGDARFFWNSNLNWLVVSTHLKNVSQIGNRPQVGLKIRNIRNHHLVKFCQNFER